jgi:hypothetical protein
MNTEISLAVAPAVPIYLSRLTWAICGPSDWVSTPEKRRLASFLSFIEAKVTRSIQESKQFTNSTASVQDKAEVLTNALLKTCPPVTVMLLQQLLRLSVRDLRQISSVISVRQE